MLNNYLQQSVLSHHTINRPKREIELLLVRGYWRCFSYFCADITFNVLDRQSNKLKRLPKHPSILHAYSGQYSLRDARLHLVSHWFNLKHSELRRLNLLATLRIGLGLLTIALGSLSLPTRSGLTVAITVYVSPSGQPRP